MEQLENIFTIVGVVVTASSAIVAGLELIANITPTTKDDEILSKVKKWLSIASAILDKVSVWNVKK